MKNTIVLSMAVALIALVPNTASLPVLCQGSCEIAGGSTHFTPPAVAVESGATVNWVPDDANTHANIDAGTLDPCFFAPFNPTTSWPVRFDIVGATVEATTTNDTNVDTTLACGNAVALPGGAFAINYFCVLHPVLMKGVLVVVPETT